MSIRDRLVPAVAGAAVLLVALMVIVLLRSAANDGTDALENAKVAQVRTTADSFNARVESSISSLGGLGSRPWELTLRSAADQATLNTFAIDPEALSGTFLVDADDTVTNGVLLRPGMLGSKFDAARVGEGQGGACLVTRRRPARGRVRRDDRAAELCLRGRHQGRAAHQRARCLRLRAGADQRLDLQPGDPRTRRRHEVHRDLAVPGQQRRRGRLHPQHRAGSSRCPTNACERCPRGCTRSATSSSSAPTFRSSGGASSSPRTVTEFAEPLAGPLQSAGLILVLLLLAVGLTLTVVLARRLRQSREQEARLRALNRSQDEFISVVSHELRTPVSGVLGFLQTSLDHWDVMSDEDRHSAVRRAFTNARRLQAMTRDVLDTESIESGRFGYVRHPMDLADEVRTAVDAFSSGSADGVVVTRAGHPGDDGGRPRPHPAGPREPPRQRTQERTVGDPHRGHPGADRERGPPHRRGPRTRDRPGPARAHLRQVRARPRRGGDRDRSRPLHLAQDRGCPRGPDLGGEPPG